MKIKTNSLTSAILLVNTLFSAPVFAAIEEVVVTAEKRSASIQDVPMSVAAIGGENVGIGKISDMSDVATTTPGINFQQFNIGEPRIYIRGIGNSSDSAGSDPAVGVFIDEVYIGRTGGTGADLFDLERVEVLRGPQGTLYGKNTNGGAINFITTRPSHDYFTKVALTVGNEGLFHTQALINGSLTDSLAGKLTIAKKDRDGFEKNVISPSEVLFDTALTNSPIIGNSRGAAGSSDDLGDIDNYSVRGQLLFDLSDSTSLLFSADYSDDESNGSCRHLENLGLGAGGTSNFWPIGTSAAYKSDIRNCSSQFDTGQERKIKGVMARLEHDMEWATLISITAWRESKLNHVDDLTSVPLLDLSVPTPPPLAQLIAGALGVPAFLIPASGVVAIPENVIDGVDEDAKQFSQEFRLTGTYGEVDWLAGVFFMKEDVERDEQFYTRYSNLAALVGLLRLDPPAPLANEGNVLFTQDSTTKSYAVYGQADWHVNDQWTLTYGIRWSRDEKEITQTGEDLLGNGLFVTGVPLIQDDFGPVKGDDDWSEVTHRATVNYVFNDDAMVYLTYSEGFKSGAFPSTANTAAGALETADPETVENIEVGLKSTWMDGRLQFNLAYYNMDYKDLQIFELNQQLLLVLKNGDAESKGFETSIAYAVTDNLTLTASYNDGEATFEEFIDTNGIDRSGNQLPMAPDKSGSLGADYYLPLNNGSALAFNLNYGWKDDYYFNSSNAEKTKQDSVGKLNVSLGWHSADESLSIAAWGKNLGDKDQLAHVIVDPTGITSKKYMDPKSYGLTITKTFH